MTRGLGSYTRLIFLVSERERGPQMHTLYIDLFRLQTKCMPSHGLVMLASRLVAKRVNHIWSNRAWHWTTVILWGYIGRQVISSGGGGTTLHLCIIQLAIFHLSLYFCNISTQLQCLNKLLSCTSWLLDQAWPVICICRFDLNNIKWMARTLLSNWPLKHLATDYTQGNNRSTAFSMWSAPPLLLCNVAVNTPLQQ
jgi:hypothetical protein